jgi:hypothetical protein
MEPGGAAPGNSVEFAAGAAPGALHSSVSFPLYFAPGRGSAGLRTCSRGATPGSGVEGRLWARLRRACDCCSALRRRPLGVASAALRLLRHRDEPGRGPWLLMRRSVGAGAASVLVGARPRAASMGAGTARGPRIGGRHTPSVSRVRGRIAPEFAGATLRLRSPCRVEEL